MFPDLDLTFVEGQRRLAGGNILDLRFRDARGVHWIVELKRARITGATIEQLGRYLAQIHADEPALTLAGMVVGFSVAASVAAMTAAAGIECRVLRESDLREIARRHGVPLDHDTGYRPKLSGTNRSRSLVRKQAGSRPPSPAPAIAFLQELDARFPPGTLDAKASLADLEEYWSAACPSAPHAHQTIAADLSRAVLSTVEGTALATRSQSVSDPYTTIRAGDGRVAAAIDARAAYVKLDFPLPPDAAADATRRGVLRIWNPRGYSVWVQSRVGRGISLAEAESLLRLGLDWEFRGVRPRPA